MTSKFTYAAHELLAMMEEHGGIADFMEKLLDNPEQYAEDIALTVITAVAEYEE